MNRLDHGAVVVYHRVGHRRHAHVRVVQPRQHDVRARPAATSSPHSPSTCGHGNRRRCKAAHDSRFAAHVIGLEDADLALQIAARPAPRRFALHAPGQVGDSAVEPLGRGWPRRRRRRPGATSVASSGVRSISTASTRLRDGVGHARLGDQLALVAEQVQRRPRRASGLS